MADKNQTTITSVLRVMEVGDTVVYPLEKTNTVKALACTLGAIEKKVYSTTMDRVARTITVKRTL